MRILQLAPRIPYPPVDGGSIASYNAIRSLALRGHEVTLLSMVQEGTNPTLDELRKWCKVRIVTADMRSSVRGAVSNLFSLTPYTMSKYHCKKLIHLLRSTLQEERFNIVHLEHLHAAYYGQFVREICDAPVILREQNIETTIMERVWRNYDNPIIKVFAYLQWRKLRKYEATLCRQADLCLMITRNDEAQIQQMSFGIKTFLVPVGIDTSFFRPLPDVKKELFTLVSIASMNWLPNVDGILWFCEKVLPLVKREIPQAKLYVVGKDPPKKIKALSGEHGCVVTGFVEDTREYMARGSVFIVPLWIGSGIRVRILNALAMGQPVVSTPIGAEGIEVEHGKEIFIADNPQSFAHQCVELLRNESLRCELGRNGPQLIQRKYSLEVIGRTLEKAYQQAIAERGRI